MSSRRYTKAKKKAAALKPPSTIAPALREAMIAMLAKADKK